MVVLKPSFHIFHNLGARNLKEFFYVVLGSLRNRRSCATDGNRNSNFSFLERFDAITFVTSSHRRPTRVFPVRCEEQKRAKRGNIRLPVAVRGSRTSVA